MNTQIANKRPSHDDVFKAAAALAAKGLKLVRVYGVTLDGVCECKKGAACKNVGKHPVGDEWQNHATTDENTIASWFENEERPVPNVGVLLGEWSGVIDVEADTEKGCAALKRLGLDQIETPAFQSGRSPHLLFRWEPGLPKKATVDDVEGIEVRLGNDRAAHTVLPPSWHDRGVAREWLPGRSPEECDLQPLPREFRDEIIRRAGTGNGKSPAKAAREATAAGKVFHEGEGRHHHLYLEAVNLARDSRCLSSHEQVERIHALVLGLNATKCKPPYPEDEVRRCTDDAIAWARTARERGVPDLDPNDPNAEQILAAQRTAWEKMGLRKSADNPQIYEPGSWALTVIHGDPVEYVLSGVMSPSTGEVSVTLGVDELCSAAKTAKKILATTTDVDPTNPTADKWQKLWLGEYDREARVHKEGLKAVLLDNSSHEYPPAEYQRYALLASWMLNYLRRFKRPEICDAATEPSPTGSPKWIREGDEVVLAFRLADAWSKAAEQAKGQIATAEVRNMDRRIRRITGEKSFNRTVRRGQSNGKAAGLTLWTTAHLEALEELARAQH